MFFKTVLLFIMQIALLFIVQMVFTPFQFIQNLGIQPYQDHHKDFPYLVLIIKWVCSLILHINQQPSIEECIKRIQFIKYHPHKFQHHTIALCIAYLKLIIEVLMELVNLKMTATCNKCSEIIMNFIAMCGIAQLDAVYYVSLQSPMKDSLEDRDRQVPMQNTDRQSVMIGFSCYDKVLLKVLVFIQFLYSSIYFYLFPTFLYFMIYNIKRQEADDSLYVMEQFEAYESKPPHPPHPHPSHPQV